MDMCCAASPSQVAMASFSSAGPPADPARDSKSKLTTFNRIQVPGPSHGPNHTGGRVWSLPISGFLTCPGTLFNLSTSSDAVVQRGGGRVQRRGGPSHHPPPRPHRAHVKQGFRAGRDTRCRVASLPAFCLLPPSLLLPFGFASFSSSEDVKVELLSP